MTQPITRSDDVDHAAALPLGSAVSRDLWTEVHEQVQGELALLEREVRQRVADVRVDAGRTKGDGFFLFSYRTFSLPDSAFDPMVSGMTFTPAKEGVTVEADVSGEQTGDCISSVPSKTVGKSSDELLAAARDLARKLSQSTDAITAAMKDPSRTVE